MLYWYDEFEQSYVVFPKKKYLDEINSIGDVYWGIFNMMDRQNKGYSNQKGHGHDLIKTSRLYKEFMGLKNTLR